MDFSESGLKATPSSAFEADITSIGDFFFPFYRFLSFFLMIQRDSLSSYCYICFCYLFLLISFSIYLISFTLLCRLSIVEYCLTIPPK